MLDGKPAVGAFVTLIPVDEPPGSLDPRPHATVDKDGAFLLSTYGADDGAPAGEYIVTLFWREIVDGREDGPDKFQGRYVAGKSPLRCTVTAGENEIPAFKLKQRE